MNAHAEKGGSGEFLAAEFLRSAKGFAMVGRNWHNPQDRREEIDLVMMDREIMVFVEVKARNRVARVPGFYAVDREKRKILKRAVHAYLSALAVKPRTFRLDVVEVVLGGPEPEIRHYVNAGLFHRYYRP